MIDDDNTATIEVGNIPDFWERLGSAPARFLGLDYDGTLAPFHADPMKAEPLPGIAEILEAICAGKDTTVVIISGRPVTEIVTLLGDLGMTLIGSHGFELRHPDGSLELREPAADQKNGLAEAEIIGQQEGYGHKLEKKIASIAFHTRGMPEELAARLEQRIFNQWSAIAESHDLECRRFNGGVEIRCSGWHKGDALAALLPAPSKESFIVYVGDDETDEDAFRSIRESGIGIKVGSPDTPTAAIGFLPDCQSVKAFLKAWLEVTK